ncbi:MAG: PD40 domain-containing protein, partial [Bacteroidales bacterium]|nr:PD40 domain-containing protein [Bacteroidales bacterium]
ISCVTFSPDGKYIASCSSDKTIKLWDVNKEQAIKTIELLDEVESVAFSSDGKYILAGSKIIKLDESEANQELNTNEFKITESVFCPNNKLIATCSADKTIKLWDAKSGAELKTTFSGETKKLLNVKLSPNGKYIAYSSFDETIRLRNTVNGTEIKTFIGEASSWIENIAFSPDSKYLAYSYSIKNPPESRSGYSHLVKLLNVENGEEISTLKNSPDDIHDIIFSPDNKSIAIYSDEKIEVLNLKNNKLITVFEGHKGAVSGNLAFSPNSKYIVSSDWSNTILLWSAENGKLIRIIFKKEGYSNFVGSVSISPDGKYIVAGSHYKVMYIWKIENGRRVRKLKGHTWLINCAVYSPDGKYIISGSNDKTLILWNANRRRKIRVFEGHTDKINTVSFSADNKFIVSSSQDGTIKIWKTETGKLLLTIEDIKKSKDWIMYTPENEYEGNNAQKYLHYLLANKVYPLPKNDPKYIVGLLSKIYK